MERIFSWKSFGTFYNANGSQEVGLLTCSSFRRPTPFFEWPCHVILPILHHSVGLIPPVTLPTLLSWYMVCKYDASQCIAVLSPSQSCCHPPICQHPARQLLQLHRAQWTKREIGRLQKMIQAIQVQKILLTILRAHRLRQNVTETKTKFTKY